MRQIFDSTTGPFAFSSAGDKSSLPQSQLNSTQRNSFVFGSGVPLLPRARGARGRTTARKSILGSDEIYAWHKTGLNGRCEEKNMQPMRSTSALVPAAEYVRMSDEKQQYSIKNQQDAIREYADAHGL